MGWFEWQIFPKGTCNWIIGLQLVVLWCNLAGGTSLCQERFQSLLLPAVSTTFSQFSSSFLVFIYLIFLRCDLWVSFSSLNAVCRLQAPHILHTPHTMMDYKSKQTFFHILLLIMLFCHNRKVTNTEVGFFT